MPELNLVATPVAAATPAATPAATADASAAADAQGGAAASPFASVLGRQIDKQWAAEKEGGKPDIQMILAEPAKDAAQAPEVLAALMPMLLGMATAGAGGAAADATAGATAKTGKPADDAKGQDPVLLAAASWLPAAPAATQATADAGTKGEAARTPTLPTTGADTATTSAILAGAAKDQPATGDDGGKANGFDNLLTAAREALPAAASAHAAAAGSAAQPQAASVAHVATPVGAQGWDNAVADKVVWMAGQQQSKADLVLNPPHMGRIEVSLTVSGDQANAVFLSPNPEVRQALESALPRLREVLLDAGINLGQAQIGAQSSGNSASGGENRDNSFRGQTTGNEVAISGDTSLGSRNPWLRTGRGLVDTFA